MEKRNIIILIVIILILASVGAYYSFSSSPSLAPRAGRNVTNVICGNGILQGAEQCEVCMTETCQTKYNLYGNDCTTVPGNFSGGILSCTSGCRFDTSGCYQNGSLYISSTPSGANIYDNGDYFGLTPRSYSTGPGSHEIILTKTGYLDYLTNVNVTSGQTTNVYGVLQLNQTNQTYLLTVSKIGTGQGTVTSNPAGINCGSDCSENYVNGTSVSLSATPNATSIFGGWSGSCSGTGSCVVVMNINRNVIANFTLNQTTLLA